MLNEKRVKQMVKLALYESRNGDEEMKISSKRKMNYVNVNTLWAIIWTTIAYVLFIVFVGLGVKTFLIADLTVHEILLVILLVIGMYLMVLFIHIPRARKYYKKKHAVAHRNVKEFKKNLAELEHMYQEEDNHGENI